MTETYFEIAANVHSEFTEQKSKFLGFAHRVQSEEEIKAIIADLRAMHPNANHVCYAYRLGKHYELYRFSDDGEPGGTAGRPIFGQIEAFKVTNVLVAVVRYFGGIKLGTGGLVANYQKSARLTLDAAQVIEHKNLQSLQFVYDYDVTSDIQQLLHVSKAVVEATDYAERCVCTVSLEPSQIDDFKHKLMQIKNTQLLSP